MRVPKSDADALFGLGAAPVKARAYQDLRDHLPTNASVWTSARNSLVPMARIFFGQRGDDNRVIIQFNNQTYCSWR